MTNRDTASMGWIAQLVEHLYVNPEVIGLRLAAVNFSLFKLKQLNYFITCLKIAILFVIRAVEFWTQYKHHLVLETYPLLTKQNTWDESTVYSTKSPMLPKKHAAYYAACWKTVIIVDLLCCQHVITVIHDHIQHMSCVCVCVSHPFHLLVQHLFSSSSVISLRFQHLHHGKTSWGGAWGSWLVLVSCRMQSTCCKLLSLQLCGYIFNLLGRVLRYFWNGRHTLLLFTFRHIHPRLFDNVLPLGKPDNCDKCTIALHHV